MPIQSVGYVTRPYASTDGRIGDLLRRRGDTTAQAILRGGEIQAQMWGRLGQMAQGAVNDYVTEKREAPIRRDEARMRGLRMQAAEREAAEPARMAAQDSAFMRLLSESPDGNPDPRAVVSIYGPQKGLTIAQGLHAFGELQRGDVKDARETAGRLALGLKVMSPQAQAALWQPVKDAAKRGGWGDAVPFPDAPDASFLDGLIQWGTGKEIAKPKDEGFTLSPGQQRFGADGKPIASVAAAPKEPTSIDAAILDAERAGNTAEVQRLLSLKGKVSAAGREPDKPNKATYEWAFDPKSGKNVYVTPDEIRAGGFQKPTGSQRPASGMEKRAMGFFNRARQADIDLEGLEPEIQGMGLGAQTRMAVAPNVLQSQTGQQYTQAQRAFTEARLRKDSGAAIPEQEFANDRQTYFAQPGDSKETLEQKRRARAAVLASLGTEAGQALAEYEGDGEAAAALVQGYKSRAQKAGGGGTPAEGTRGVVNGQPAVWKTVNGKAGWYAAD